MANYRYYARRIRRLISQPPFQILSICAVLFFGIRWVLQHNHDDDGYHAPIARQVNSVENPRIDWSKLYYAQYITSQEYLCNALMVWSEIEEIGSRAQRIMFYPSSWDPNEIDEVSQDLTPIARLLQQAQTDYFVKLQAVDVLDQNGTKESTWADSYTKLLAFNLTQFDRVLALDSNSIVLQNLDGLFLLQKAPLAMPYVYWGEPTGWSFSSSMLLITPSASSFAAISSAISEASADEHDVDILTPLFKNGILRIPQRPYSLLSGEFRRKNHVHYLRSHPRPSARNRKWDPDLVLTEAKVLHYEDWPIPKPWIRAKKEVLNKYMPKCVPSEWFGASDCRDRAVWLKLYSDFEAKRLAVCGEGFELRSQEGPEDSIYRHGRWFHSDEVG